MIRHFWSRHFVSHRVVALALVLAATSLFAAPPPVTTIIVVRHAEKAGTTGDVPLSDAGRARAQELARVLAGAGVTAIYDTQYIRTQQTAEPLAAALKVKPTLLGTTASYAHDVAHDIELHHSGATVVVVSHSNLIPDLLKAFGIAELPSIGDAQYDDLFVVTLASGATTKLVALRYGAPAR